MCLYLSHNGGTYIYLSMSITLHKNAAHQKTTNNQLDVKTRKQSAIFKKCDGGQIAE